MDIDPAKLAVQDRYKLLIGCVTPRPIALVSTVDAMGRENLAPYSFFNACGSDPMTLMFCPANNPDGSMKDSMRNALPPGWHGPGWEPGFEGGTGEFVVNLAYEPYIRRVAACAEPLDHGESEYDLSGLTPEPSAVVAPPRVRESPVSFECETWRVIRTNEDQPAAPNAGNIVIGRVVHVRVHEGVLNDRFHADPAALQTVGRMGGLNYCTTRDRFEMPMGHAALAGTEASD